MTCKKQLLFVGFLLKFISTGAQGTNFSLITSQYYRLNFWDNIENYNRKQGANNFGFQLGVLYNYKTVNFSILFSKENQNYIENYIYPISPRKIGMREYKSTINAIELNVGRTIEIMPKVKMNLYGAFGISEFRKTHLTNYYGDGTYTNYKLNVSSLHRRLGVSNGIQVNYHLKKCAFGFDIGNSNIILGLRNKIEPPITLLEANSRVSIFFKIVISYRI